MHGKASKEIIHLIVFFQIFVLCYVYRKEVFSLLGENLGAFFEEFWMAVLSFFVVLLVNAFRASFLGVTTDSVQDSVAACFSIVTIQLYIISYQVETDARNGQLFVGYLACSWAEILCGFQEDKIAVAIYLAVVAALILISIVGLENAVFRFLSYLALMVYSLLMSDVTTSLERFEASGGVVSAIITLLWGAFVFSWIMSFSVQTSHFAYQVVETVYFYKYKNAQEAFFEMLESVGSFFQKLASYCFRCFSNFLSFAAQIAMAIVGYLSIILSYLKNTTEKPYLRSMLLAAFWWGLLWIAEVDRFPIDGESEKVTASSGVDNEAGKFSEKDLSDMKTRLASYKGIQIWCRNESGAAHYRCPEKISFVFHESMDPVYFHARENPFEFQELILVPKPMPFRFRFGRGDSENPVPSEFVPDVANNTNLFCGSSKVIVFVGTSSFEGGSEINAKLALERAADIENTVSAAIAEGCAEDSPSAEKYLFALGAPRYAGAGGAITENRDAAIFLSPSVPASAEAVEELTQALEASLLDIGVNPMAFPSRKLVPFKK